LPVYVYSLFSKAHFIIDAHTDALLASYWTWSLPLHRFLSRRALTTIVTNDYLQSVVASWNARSFVLTDVPLFLPRREQVYLDEAPFKVVMISSASPDEPTAEVLEAASRLPDVRFYITGDYDARRKLMREAPPNLRFTGRLPDREFYELLQVARAVICLTTEDNTLQSGASEALWLGKPIITSDWPLLRSYFDRGTIHVDNRAESIRQAVMTIRDNLSGFEAEILALQELRRHEWWQKVDDLIQIIERAVAE
jgi:glycosyltransferase involved in cell wall biosynthesis